VDTPATVTVTVRDRFGNVATGYRGTLHFVLTDAAATPIADVTFTAAMQGTTTIQVSFVTSGEQFRNRDRDRKRIADLEHHYPGPRRKRHDLLPLGAPASALACEPLSLAITARDSHGNVVKNYAGTAHVTSTDPSDRLPLDGGFTSGVRTVSLAFLTPRPNLATVNEAGGTISVNTTSVNVVSGDAADLLVSARPPPRERAPRPRLPPRTPRKTPSALTWHGTFSSTDAQRPCLELHLRDGRCGSAHVPGDAQDGKACRPLVQRTRALALRVRRLQVAPANATNCSVTGLPVSAGCRRAARPARSPQGRLRETPPPLRGHHRALSSDGTAQLSPPRPYRGRMRGNAALHEISWRNLPRA